jgi:hypothetical protein
MIPQNKQIRRYKQINRSQNRCHTFLECQHVHKTCAFHDALQVGKQKEVHRTPLIWRQQTIPKQAFADSLQKLYERCQQSVLFFFLVIIPEHLCKPTLYIPTCIYSYLSVYWPAYLLCTLPTSIRVILSNSSDNLGSSRILPSHKLLSKCHVLFIWRSKSKCACCCLNIYDICGWVGSWKTYRV